jgi:hypothetical protein
VGQPRRQRGGDLGVVGVGERIAVVEQAEADLEGQGRAGRERRGGRQSPPALEGEIGDGDAGDQEAVRADEHEQGEKRAQPRHRLGAALRLGERRPEGDDEEHHERGLHAGPGRDPERRGESEGRGPEQGGGVARPAAEPVQEQAERGAQARHVQHEREAPHRLARDEEEAGRHQQDVEQVRVALDGRLPGVEASP